MPRKILIVDDSKVDRVILRGILEKEYNVAEAENGKEALSMLVANPYVYSIVITDLMMPMMDGYEFVKRIRQSGYLNQIPIILATSEVEDASLVKAMSCGANNFIVKPYSFDLLLAMIKNNISLHETAAISNEMQRDKLTGILNRKTFMREAEKLIRRHDPGYYVLSSFDITHFKVVNDQYGHQMGDRVLKHVASVFKESFGGIGGICSRVTDDRFAVLYPAVYADSEIIKAIHDKASRVEGLSSPLNFCVGRYIVSDPSLASSTMYDRAILAGETIKGRYGEKATYYNEGILERLLYEQQIVSDMERALREDEFEPWFQPQYNHATGALIGAEALVRWRKNGSLISPCDFIPVFEKNGFIYQIDKYIWRRVCEYLRLWQQKGRMYIPVSVNISRYDLYQPDFIKTICELVREYDLPIDLLRLEITESAFSESSRQIVAAVAQLVEIGFTVEIDDFGSGYSSLNTLKDVPAQVLKLDMRFLEAGNSQRGGNIVESVVRMAKWLGMSVIAEGVETVNQANYLISIGCCYVQGYLYAKAMPVAEYEKLTDGCKNETGLLPMETVENLDNNAFWNPDSMDTLIFNSYVGAACIFEYYSERAELLRINRKYARLFSPNASVEDVFKRSILENMGEENRRELIGNIKKAVETGDEATFETAQKGLLTDGEVMYLRSTLRVIARAGNRYLLYAMVEDITQNRVAEEKRRHLLDEMRGVTADMPGGFVRILVKPDGKYEATYNNAGFNKLVKMDDETLYSRFAKNPMADVHPDDWHIVRSAVNEIIENGEARSLRYRMLRGDGSYVWVTVFGRFTKDQNGRSFLNLYYVDETARDNDAHQRETLLDNLPCGAGIYELKDGQIFLVYQNKSYWELVGLDKETYPDPAPLSAIHPDDVPAITRALARATQTHADAICDVRLRHLTKGFIPVRLIGRMVKEESGSTLIFATFIPKGDGGNGGIDN